MRWIWILALVVELLSLTPGTASAQYPEGNLGNWLGFTSATRFTDHWSFFGQGELRTWEMGSNLNETLFRVAGHYDFNATYMGAFGYVRVDTWPFDDSFGLQKFEENRLYQELLIKQTVWTGNLNHRFRLEQRWLSSAVGEGFASRARYMIQFTKPLNNDKLVPGTNYVRALDEIFIDFDRNDYWFNPIPYDQGLNQNRLALAMGRQLTKDSSFQVGLLWQHRPDTDVFRLLLSYSINFDRRGNGR